MIGFKVVLKTSFGTLMSCSVHGHGSCQYKIGVPTTPEWNNGPLAVFRTLENAATFLSTELSHRSINFFVFEVYEVEYVPSDENRVWHEARIGLGEGFDPPYCTLLESHLRNLPLGTVLAKSVTLIRKVEGVELTQIKTDGERSQ